MRSCSLKISFRSTTTLSYYKIYSSESFSNNKVSGTSIELKIKKNTDVLNYTLSPDNKWAAFVSKKEGKFFWILHDKTKNS